jgi:MFS family permease
VRRWPTHLLRINLSSVDDWNAWYLCVEILWAAVLGSAATFNAAFALRLGAESSHIGLLSSVPALLAILVSVPAGDILGRVGRPKRWILGSLLVHWMGYVLVALIPFLPERLINRGAALAVLLAAISAPATFFGVGWSSLLADIVPDRRRATVFATRNIISTATTSLCTFLAGLWLAGATFPVNYQLLYGVGFVASLVSLSFLTRLQVPEAEMREEEGDAGRRSRTERWGLLRDTLRAHQGFVRITLDMFVFNLPAWTAGPLYILLFVRELGASDAWLGLHGMIANVAAIAGYAVWRRIIRRVGEGPTLQWTAAGAMIYPIAAGLSGALGPVLVAVVLDGLIAPAINLSHFAIFLRACPTKRRPLYVGIYSTLMNLGAFVAPLVGVWLANSVGLGPLLVVCGLLRGLGGLMFRFFPVCAEEPRGQ